jgi:hypothetical protein
MMASYVEIGKSIVNCVMSIGDRERKRAAYQLEILGKYLDQVCNKIEDGLKNPLEFEAPTGDANTLLVVHYELANFVTSGTFTKLPEGIKTILDELEELLKDFRKADVLLDRKEYHLSDEEMVKLLQKFGMKELPTPDVALYEFPYKGEIAPSGYVGEAIRNARRLAGKIKGYSLALKDESSPAR